MSWLRLELEKSVGRANMHRAANNSLVLTDSSSFNQLAEVGNRVGQDGLYQRLTRILTSAFHMKQAVSQCAEKLVYVADHAYAARQLDILGDIGELLLILYPSGDFESVGQYYRALHLSRAGLGDVARARVLFEKVADNGRLGYRSKAMLALGSSFLRDSDHNHALSLYREVIRLMTLDRIFDPVTACIASRLTAVIKAFQGDHIGALADLEKLFPLALVAASLQPNAYHDYLNTLAVELGEVGRVDQARHLSEIAIASPLASAYPEWRETFDDIQYKQRRASRSIVAVPKQVGQTSDAIPQETPDLRSNWPAQQSIEMPGQHFKRSGNLVLLPVTERRVDSTRDKEKGRLLSFRKWKMASQKPCHLQPEKLTPEQRESLTTPQKLVRIIDLISRDETDDEAIDRILDAVEEIALGKPEDQVG